MNCMKINATRSEPTAREATTTMPYSFAVPPKQGQTNPATVEPFPIGKRPFPQVVAHKRQRKVNQKIALAAGFGFGMIIFAPVGIPLAVSMGLLNSWIFYDITKGTGRAREYRLQKDLETEERLQKIEAHISRQVQQEGFSQ